MLPQTQSHTKFFVTQRRVIRREILGEIALIVGGAAPHRALQEPFASAPLVTQFTDFFEQSGYMNGIAQLLSQSRSLYVLRQFHAATLTTNAGHWRPTFRSWLHLPLNRIKAGAPRETDTKTDTN